MEKINILASFLALSLAAIYALVAVALLFLGLRVRKLMRFLARSELEVAAMPISRALAWAKQFGARQKVRREIVFWERATEALRRLALREKEA